MAAGFPGKTALITGTGLEAGGDRVVNVLRGTGVTVNAYLTGEDTGAIWAAAPSRPALDDREALRRRIAAA